MNSDVLGMLDIHYWKMPEICPRCGMNLKNMHPAYNVYPHWAGTCEPKKVEPR